ncbi:MAG: FGGY family carbohydrate kinase [Alphaproteobacteria bacterium]
MPDLVVGLDSSTQSTKAIAWDRAGNEIAHGRAPVTLSNPAMFCFEQDPDEWWSACGTAFRGLFAKVDPARVAGVAISNQRETVAFLDEAGRSVRPAMIWLDERARAYVAPIVEAIGHDRLHRITGRPPDVIPVLFRLAWMKDHEPEAYARTAWFADVQGFLVEKLTGNRRTGWTSADPMGLYDLEAKRWSAELLGYLGLEEARLSQALAPGSEMGRVTAAAAAATGLAAGTPIFAAGGDGQCAGLGAGCIRSDRAYVNLGTALVGGIWSPDYLCTPAWRTELAAQGEGYIFETCVRSGAFLINWFTDNLLGSADRGATLAALEKRAAAVPIGSGGVMALPYWSGAMDPHWDASARGCLFGMGGNHDVAHVYRALLEGLTLHQVAALAEVEVHAGIRINEYVLIGGGAASALWRQILADAAGLPVLVGETVEASSLGAAMAAACGAGWYPSITAAAQAMLGPTTATEPIPANTAAYRELLQIFRDLYGATADINHRLVDFAVRRQAEAGGKA